MEIAHRSVNVAKDPDMTTIKRLFEYTLEYRFQYYPARANAMEPLGFITLYDFLSLHQNKEKADIFQKIAAAEAKGDMKQKAELKQNNLKVFTPCVIIGNGKDGRPWKNYDHIESFTGLAVLDFDHLPYTETADKFKKYIFDTYKCIIAAWLSPSRHGIKALVSIPIVKTVDEFKLYFWGLENEFKQYGDAKTAQWFDGSGQNPTLSLFQSYDPDLLIAENFTPWTKKGVKETAYKYELVSSPSPNIEITSKNRETVLKIINTGFRNIVSTGHPPLRSLCISIGGYVAAGYLTQTEAEQLTFWHIANHPYLRKGITGYQKTAKWGINEGTKRPVIL